MTQYKLLDITSFVASIMIVALHYHPFISGSIADHWFTLMCRIAVPIYFLRSGYFFKQENFRSWLKRIAILMLVWSVVYLPLCILSGRCDNIVDFITISFTKGTYYHLWYFPSLIFSVCLLWILVKIKVGRPTLFAIALALYMMGILYSIESNLIQKIPIIGYFFERLLRYYDTPYYCPLFNGFMFVVSGYILRNAKTNSIYVIKRIWYVFLVLSILLLYIEEIVSQYYFPHTQTEISLGILALSICVFRVIITKEAKIRISDEQSKRLRLMSTIIYVTHCWIGFAVLHVLHLSSLCNYLLILALSVTFAVVLSNKSIRIPFFKYIF